MKKIKKHNKGFTLLELLVVVLIIGILVAIALPKYQLAVDKARFTKMMDFTRAIAESQTRALMVKTFPIGFNDLDIDIPSNCVFVSDDQISCDNGTWGCYLNEQYFYPRCGDLKINVTYFYTETKRYCYAHTKDVNDRANRLCRSITGESTHFDDQISLFTGAYIPVNGYRF